MCSSDLEELITRGYDLARKLGIKISNHTAGGTFSLEKGFLKYLRETGRTDVRYLMQLGILDPHWVMIHCIHNTDLDLEQMNHVGAHLVYTPSSESIRGGGIGPASNAHRAGVNVSLGTDGHGMSDTRGALRRHFLVDAESIVVQTLASLARRGEVEASTTTGCACAPAAGLALL